MVCKTSCNSQGFVCFTKQALGFNFTSFSFVEIKVPTSATLGIEIRRKYQHNYCIRMY